MTPKRWVLIGVLAVVAVVFGLTAALSGPGKRMMLRRVRLEMARTLPCRSSVKDIRVGLFRGVELRDLRLSTGDKEQVQIFSARSVRLRVGPMGLMRGNAPFREIDVDHASAMLIRDADFRINFVELLNEIHQRNPEGTAVPRVVITDMRVDWLDFASTTIPAHGMVRVRSARIRNTNDGYAIENSKFQVGDTLVAVRGIMPTQDGRPINMEVRISPLKMRDMIQFGQLALRPRAFPPIHIEGDGIFEGSIFGVRGNERVEGALFLNGGRLGVRKLRRARVRFESSKSGDIELKECSLRMDSGGLLLVRGKIKPKAPWTFAVETTARNFPIEAIFGTLFQPAAMTGIANGDFSLKGNPEDNTSYRGDAQIEIREGTVPNTKHRYEKPTEFHSIITDFRVADGNVRISRGLLESDDMQLELSGTAGFDQTLNLGGKCGIRKGAVDKGFFRKLISKALPDDAFGYRFPVHIGGTFDQPDISIRTTRTLAHGVQDNVRDTGNRIEKFFKDRF